MLDTVYIVVQTNINGRIDKLIPFTNPDSAALVAAALNRVDTDKTAKVWTRPIEDRASACGLPDKYQLK